MWSRRPAREKKLPADAGRGKKKKNGPQRWFSVFHRVEHVCIIKLKGGKKYLPSHDIHMVRYHGTTPPHTNTHTEKRRH